MATPILLPRQGQSVESCIITEFYVSVGDSVSAGTALFAYETDKASFEEEATVDGTILAIFFEEGDEVPVLTNVGVIGEEGESTVEFAPGGEEQGAEDKEPVGSGQLAVSSGQLAVSSEQEAVDRGQRVEIVPVENVTISPRAKRLAEKESVDFQSIKGSGPNSRIIEVDILKYLETRPRITPLAKKIMKEEGLVVPEPGAEARQRVTSQDLVAANTVYASDSEIVPLTNIRKLIAGAMHRSLQNSAQLTHHLSADARRILEIRQKVKAAQKEGYAHNLTLNDMVCMAVVKTLKAYPNANSHFLGESLRVFNKVHLGLAVDTERGLMVPAIKNADDLSIQGLSSQMKAVAESCRGGNVDPDLLAPEAASFTVSNLGNYGVEMFTPVINLPQVAILGVNTIIPRPKDLGNGVYGFVPHLGLSLTYDHQALDGGEATRFLKAIATEIENLEIEL
jgi:pyruvate dehydrogenase E2 component (dihydrolipoamide acetyltransferase)